ncbi:hypothetical protein DFH06DRAFT_1308829 [Mycena polygramma]|nr:hypothetical protein DFH06DRAFT_1308829 [Mycena polygramma]
MSQVGKLTIPLFIGTVINWSLSGVLAVQVYLYFLAFPKDRTLTKVLVVFACIIEFLQTLADSHDTLVIFGADWGKEQSLDRSRWGWFSVPILGSIGDCLRRPGFFCVEDQDNRPNALSIVQLGAGIWTGVNIVSAGKFSVMQFDRVKAPVVWLATSAASDLFIVFGTVFFLMKARQTVLGKTTTSLAISRIIKVSAETGLVCALFAVADLSLYVAFDGNNYHLGICIWLSKLYSNSMLVILNSPQQDSVRVPTTKISFRRPGGPPPGAQLPMDIEAQSLSSLSSSPIDLSEQLP